MKTNKPAALNGTSPDDEKPNATLEAFVNMYEPSGYITDKEMMTTSDIQSTLKEMCLVDLDIIYKRLTESGYSIEFVDGKPYFALYKVKTDSYFK